MVKSFRGTVESPNSVTLEWRPPSKPGLSSYRVSDSERIDFILNSVSLLSGRFRARSDRMEACEPQSHTLGSILSNCAVRWRRAEPKARAQPKPVQQLGAGRFI